eukprot:403374366
MKIPKIEKCLYQTLGVSKDANTQEIKQAYLNLAKVYHPDKNSSSLEYFTHVSKAYETLSDPQKRAIYDDDQIPDEEFFTIRIGKLKINLFTTFMISLFGCAGYYAYYLLIVKQRDVNTCPVDTEEFKNAGHQHHKRKQ